MEEKPQPDRDEGDREVMTTENDPTVYVPGLG
jgi:hypothetical protein